MTNVYYDLQDLVPVELWRCNWNNYANPNIRFIITFIEEKKTPWNLGAEKCVYEFLKHKG